MHKLANHGDLQAVVDLANNRVEAGLRSLIRMGFAPELVIDVGAHSGEWTRLALPFFPGARFVMLEAQREKEAALERVRHLQPERISYSLGLLGREPRQDVEFFLADTGSSLYPEKTAFRRERTTLSMTTLDLALADRLSVGEAFLKMDVQGAELEVLAGAKRVLEKTNAVLSEVSLVQYNEQAPRVAEVVAAMADLGFLLFDIWDLRRIGPILAQADFLFVRRGSPLDSRAGDVISAYGR
jgi:FkbM family methyltransferase